MKSFSLVDPVNPPHHPHPHPEETLKLSVIETNSEEEADWSVGMRLQLAPRREVAYFVADFCFLCRRSVTSALGS